MNVYGWVRASGGVSWYRVQEPFRGLQLRGHHTRTGLELNLRKLADIDVIVLSVTGETDAAAGWETLAHVPRSQRPLMVYDIDDDVWNFRQGLGQYEYWSNRERLLNVQSGIACSDIVTTPSYLLAQYLRELNPNVYVLPNYVPEKLLRVQLKRPWFTIGYQGGDTHKFDVAMIGPQITKFLADHNDARMRVWGVLSYDGVFADRVITHPWQRDIWEYYLSLDMTVGLAPLEDLPFNHCKSGIKAVEYAALGIPCLASYVAPYWDTVQDGTTGFVCSDDEWYDQLTYLYENRAELLRMRDAARNCARGWTTEGNAHKWESVYARHLEMP